MFFSFSCISSFPVLNFFLINLGFFFIHSFLTHLLSVITFSSAWCCFQFRTNIFSSLNTPPRSSYFITLSFLLYLFLPFAFIIFSVHSVSPTNYSNPCLFQSSSQLPNFYWHHHFHDFYIIDFFLIVFPARCYLHSLFTF